MYNDLFERVNSLKLYKQISIVIALSVTAAAFVSHSLWGYAFVRPDIPSFARDATQVKAVIVVSNWRPENAGILQKDGNWQGRLALSKKHPYDIPEGRVLGVWQELNLLSNGLSELPIETADQALTAINSYFPEGSSGYESNAANRSAVVALFDGDIGKDLLFVAVRGGQYLNDHFAYREFVLKPEEHGYQFLQHSGFEFDVAGIEGLEFPYLFVIFFMLITLLVVFFKLIWFIAVKCQSRVVNW
jgi:hypothetical protein